MALSLRHGLDLPVGFEGARYTPITTQRHLHNAVGYILGNASRHENPTDPRCEGSNLPDLLGLRLTGPHTGCRLRRLLPRLTRADLLLHLPVDELHPGRDPRFLADVAAAALALPDPGGRDGMSRLARFAAVHVADRLQLATAHTAALLEISTRTVRRHRREAPDPRLLRALQLQMGLMESVPGGIRTRTPCTSRAMGCCYPSAGAGLRDAIRQG